jgi:hypothetical protein
MVPELPVIELVVMSVAVMFWLPAVVSVAENVPRPEINGIFPGSCAFASLLVKCTVPEYTVVVLFEASIAVTVMVNEVPDGIFAGATTKKCVAAASTTPPPVPPPPPAPQPFAVMALHASNANRQPLIVFLWPPLMAD